MNNRDFFASNRIGSETLMAGISQTSNSSPPQKVSEGARDLLILIDSVIICIHFGNCKPPASLKITTAASVIQKMLVVTATNFLK